MGPMRRLLPLAAAIGLVATGGALYIADRPLGQAAVLQVARMADSGPSLRCSVRDGLDEPPPPFVALPACR